MTPEQAHVEQINKHLNVLNDIGNHFRLVINDEKEALRSALECMKAEVALDELTLLLYNDETKQFDFILYVDKRGIIEGEEIIPIYEKANSFYLDLYQTRKRSIYQKDTCTIYIPIRTYQRFIGVLRAGNNVSKIKIPKRTVDYLIDYADAIATGVYDVRLSIDRQKNIEKLVAISKITTSMIGTLDKDKVLTLILKSIVNHLGFDRVKLYMVNEDESIIHGVFSYDIRGVVNAIDDEIYPLIYKNDIIINSLEEQQKNVFKKNESIMQLIRYFPLKVKNQIIGFVEVDNIFSRQQITNENINYLNLFINQASIALENARLYRRVEELSIRDGLTGLYTHRYFYNELEHELSRMRRYKHNLSLIMLDIDYFKKYNDSYGHIIGDELLVNVAGIIDKNIRQSDYAARYGGDEFVILLIGTTEDEAKMIAERIKYAIRKFTIKIDNKRVHITASIGVALSVQSDMSGKKFIELADKALYEAKRAGRNRVWYWGESESTPIYDISATSVVSHQFEVVEEVMPSDEDRRKKQLPKELTSGESHHRPGSLIDGVQSGASSSIKKTNSSSKKRSSAKKSKSETSKKTKPRKKQ